MKKRMDASNSTVNYLIYGRKESPMLVVEDGVKKETYFDGSVVNKITRLDNGAKMYEKYTVGRLNMLMDAGVDVQVMEHKSDSHDFITTSYDSKENYNNNIPSKKVTCSSTIDRTITNTIDYAVDNGIARVGHVVNNATLFQSGYKYEEIETFDFNKGIIVADTDFAKAFGDYTAECDKYSFETTITNTSKPSDVKHTCERYNFDQNAIDAFDPTSASDGERLGQIFDRPCIIQSDMTAELSMRDPELEK